MADPESNFLSKVIDTGKAEEIMSMGITPEMFANDETRGAYEFIRTYVRKYKEAPTREAVKENCPNFDLVHVQESIEYHRDKFSERVVKRAAQEALLELAEATDDPDRSKDIVGEFLSVSRDLATMIPTGAVSKFSDSDKRKVEYEKEAAKGIPPGIPYGYPTIDAMTGGLKPHQFAVLSAYLGIGKSTALNSFAFNMWGDDDRDVVIMIATLELQASALMKKFDAMAAGMNYRDIENLRLSDEAIERWNETAKNIRRKQKKKTSEIIVIDSTSIPNATPDAIYAETVKHKPDVVFVDYIGLMKSSTPARTSSQWQTMVEISRDLKQNAMVLNTPIVAAAQTNRDGAKSGSDLSNIGSSVSIAQDCDVFIGMHADDDMKQRNEMQLKVLKNRMGPLGDIDCTWDHENNYFGEGDGPKNSAGVPVAKTTMFPGRRKPTGSDDDGNPTREVKPKRKRPNPKPSPMAVKASNKEVNARLNKEEEERSAKKRSTRRRPGS